VAVAGLMGMIIMITLIATATLTGLIYEQQDGHDRML
jgi:hypothetical protein